MLGVPHASLALGCDSVGQVPGLWGHWLLVHALFPQRNHFHLIGSSPTSMKWVLQSP